MKKIWMWGISVCLSAAAVMPAAAQRVRGSQQPAESTASQPMRPDGKGYGMIEDRPGINTVVTGNGIDYHGGPVMKGTVNVYYIWYGNWGSNSAKTILTNLAQYIGGSPYYNINTTYGDNSGNVSNSVRYAGAINDNYSYGTSLSDSAVKSVVNRAITYGYLPKDPNGVYFVLTTKDVNETSGFCSRYCGWHSNGSISGSDIKYAFIGNPDRCPSSCEAQTGNSPNGNPGADGMASIISHELEEATSDPDGTAWWQTSTGEENADKCAWTFGSYYRVANGSYANMSLGGRYYLIQRNWVNRSGGYCALSY